MSVKLLVSTGNAPSLW